MPRPACPLLLVQIGPNDHLARQDVALDDLAAVIARTQKLNLMLFDRAVCTHDVHVCHIVNLAYGGCGHIEHLAVVLDAHLRHDGIAHLERTRIVEHDGRIVERLTAARQR